MKLSIRLNMIANLVEKCESIGDIGTDHGYIPIYLVENSICRKAIASDINKGPVKKAKHNIAINNLSDRIQCRLGSGLNTIKEGEVQGVIIAGMGGNLIRDIICENYDVFKSLDFAVLQPSQNPEVLRRFLYNEGISILKEDMCIDDGIYYEAMKVRFDNASNINLPDINYEISPYLLKNKHPLIGKYIDKKIDENRKILLKISDNGENAIKKKREIEDRINRLEELKGWL